MSLETFDLDVTDLTPHHSNPRRGNVDLIAESLQANGQYRAIVVNRGSTTGRPFEVLAGNHTLKAAVQLGWETISAHIIDVDDTTATRILVVDNRANDVAEYDNRALLTLLQTMPSLEGTGFNEDNIADLLSELEQYEMNSLDDLQNEFGEPEDDDLWVNYSIKLPQNLKSQLEAAVGAMPGGTDPDRVQALLNKLR